MSKKLPGVNLSVSAKVVAIVSLSLLGMIGLSGYINYELKNIGDELTTIADQDIPLTEVLSNITAHQLAQTVAFEKAMRYAVEVEGNPKAEAQLAKAKQEFEHLAEKVDGEIKDGLKLADEAIVNAHSERDLKEFKHVLKTLVEVDTQHSAFNSHVRETFALLDAENRDVIYEKEQLIEEEVTHLNHKIETLLVHIASFTDDTVHRVQANEQSVMYFVMAITAIVFITVAALSWYVMQITISKPLRTLVDAVDTLTRGDTNIDINVRSHDEIGRVAAALSIFRDSMIENERLSADAKSKAQELEQQKHQSQLQMADALEQHIKSVTAAIGDDAVNLEAAAKLMADLAGEADQQCTKVGTASEESSANVQTVATASGQLDSAIGEISVQVSRTSNVADDAQMTGRRASETILKLSDMSKKIGDVVKLISDIAEQTNLLALNATIEAARAGDAGKGFAVVAGEVKNLANQTARATEDISEQVSAMQLATDDSVSTIEEIRGVLDTLKENATSIAAAVEQQRCATADISQNVHNAAQAVQEISVSVQTAQQAASKSGTTAGDVLTAASDLMVQSDKLNSHLDGFLSRMRAGA